jgi:hypothetical protein
MEWGLLLMSEMGAGKDTSAAVPENPENRLVRPTLYIGLGGTGASILTALRRRILQRQWNGRRLESLDDFKVASFLYFDTFSGEAKDVESRQKEGEPEDPIAPLVALSKSDCIQAGLDPAKYLKHDTTRGTSELDSYAHVKDWLPAEELSSINLEEGAGQIRSMSRLLFFDRIADIQSQISSKVRQLQHNLTERTLLAHYGLETTDKVNVKIVGSAAGGTGSGTFIDMGYLCKALKDPEPEEVSLWLVLGGAFAGQGKRVLANTYAALAELEYAMKLRYGDQPFVKTWDGRLGPAGPRAYDRLYLFDSSNTAKIGVDQQGRDYVFRMIADLLLQEVAEPDLVGKRRGDLSNQDTKYREPMYAPAVVRQYEGQGLQYSRLYSGIGQSMVETSGRIEFQAQGAEIAIGMLRAYFRIDGSVSVAPKPTAVEDFLFERLHLGPARQFVVHKDLRSAPVLNDYPLVFSRLLAKDGASLLGSVENDVARDFQRMMESPLAEWPTHAMDIAKQRRAEIEQESAEREKAGLNLRARGVEDAARRLIAELTAAEGLVRKGILGLIDSDIGGISYAEQFVMALKARLVGYWAPLFRRDADTYGDLAGKIMSQLYAQAADNLQKESKGSILAKPNRQTMETIANQLKDTLTTWMQYRLRQIACHKAVEILRAVDAMLGESIGAGADGRPQYTGILNDIHEGLATVENAITDLEMEAALIRDPDTAHNPIYQVVGGTDAAVPLSADSESCRFLAVKAFESYGGATRLFSELRERRKRAEVLSRLRHVASEETGSSGRPLMMAESEVPGVVEELSKLPRNRLEDVINNAVKQSMPWVNIRKTQIGQAWSEDMNSIFVCVRDAEGFKEKFGGVVARAVQSHVDATKEINYVESSTPGRLVVCTELSGLPLDALVQLHDDWFRQYEHVLDDSTQAPLHTHKEWEKFGRPTAPDAAEMKERLDDLGLFLQGVAFGKLRRRSRGRFPASPEKWGQYEIDMTTGLTAHAWVPIGRELKVRNYGLKTEHRMAIEAQVQEMTSGFNTDQLLAAVALFEYYQHKHYTPTLLGKDETRRRGLGHLSSGLLVKDFMQRFQETPEGRTKGQTSYIAGRVRALLNALDAWTVEIEDSLDDVDNTEANKDPKSDIENRPAPKRVIKFDIFDNPETLAGLIHGSTNSDKAKPEAEGARFYWYKGRDGKPQPRAMDGDGIRRLIGSDDITPETKLCLKGTKEWRPAESWPEFVDSFASPPPDEDEAPPED